MKPKFQFTPLSTLQIRRLCAMASQAYKAAKKRHAIDDDVKAEDYRRAGQIEACGLASLKDCNQSHFLLLRAHWFVIIGNLEEAFNDLLRAGDGPEALSQLRKRFVGQIAALSEAIHAKHLRETGVDLAPDDTARRAVAYAEGMSRDKNGGKAIKALDADQLAELGWTVTNRANAMQGKGSPETRNKKQRLPKAAPMPPEDTHDGGSFMDRARQRLKKPAWGTAQSGSDRL